MKAIIAMLAMFPLYASAGGISVQDFHEAIARDEATFAGKACAVQVKDLAEGLAIRATSSDSAAELLIKMGDEIAFSDESRADGSYVRHYEVPGVGKLSVLYAEDSYAEFELLVGDRSVKCSTDF